MSNFIKISFSENKDFLSSIEFKCLTNKEANKMINGGILELKKVGSVFASKDRFIIVKVK